MFKLIVNPGSDQAWEIPLSPGVTRLGSGPDSALPIQHDTVSAEHCEIRVEDGLVVLKDLGSSGGTFVDQAPVTECRLAPGQAIRLGEVELRLVCDDSQRHTNLVASSAASLSSTASGERMFVAGRDEVRCKYHPKSSPVWTCRKCRAYFCDLCVNVRPTNEGVGHFCRRCGNECAPVQLEIRESVPKTFFQMLPGAFRYPFQGNGLILLAAGTVFFLLVQFVASTTAIFGPYAFILLLLGAISVTGYVFSYAKRIVTSTVQGEISPPDWPDFSDWKEDMIVPFGQLLALAALTFGPAIVLHWWHPLGDAHAGATVTAAMALGCLLAPMGLLALALFDSVSALNPVSLVWSILRIPGHYLIAAVIFELVLGMTRVFGSVTDFLRAVPYLPSLLNGFVNLYLMTIGMRILGLLYVSKKRQLGWFRR